MSVAALGASNVTHEEEDISVLLASCDRDSAVWKEILIDNDLLGSLEDQFVDFVRYTGDSVLDLLANDEPVIEQTVEDIDFSSIDGKEGELYNGVDKLLPTTSDIQSNGRNEYCTQKNVSHSAGDAMDFKCGVCLLIFKIRAHLIRHMLLKHNQIGVHKAEKIYGRCRRCNELFKTTIELEKHLKKEHETTLFCDICLRLFSNAGHLERHRSYHGGVNPFVCDVCKKQCRNSSHLHFHRRTHFVADQGYRCKYCDKQFSSAGNCHKHMARVHTMEKRYKCSQCTEAFIYTRQLKIHEKQIHASKSYGPHDCERCDLAFRDREELKSHQKDVHYQKDRPHACDQCSARFKQTGHLKTHKLTHSGSKPYGCDICDKRFLTGHDLNVHRRSKHSKEKPFQCDKCGKAFIVGYLLNQHLLKSHATLNASTKK
ncbi:zinc finger protein 664-like [Malaya genurostris]|uniref:zinc finger protein 664-like n=1 Tax=Malaya genurostris TaxID=325434 RepID=UPI0026F3BED0|nr:zinc finger protein 664-like [Malaya genurostris]